MARFDSWLRDTTTAEIRHHGLEKTSCDFESRVRGFDSLAG